MGNYLTIENIKNWIINGTEIIVYWTPYFKAKQIAEFYWLDWYEHLLLIDDIKQLKWIKIDDYLQLFVQEKYPKINIITKT